MRTTHRARFSRIAAAITNATAGMSSGVYGGWKFIRWRASVTSHSTRAGNVTGVLAKFQALGRTKGKSGSPVVTVSQSVIGSAAARQAATNGTIARRRVTMTYSKTAAAK